MEGTDINAVVRLALDHQWIALAAIVINLAVRLLKSGRIPALTEWIPPKARVLVALLLGFVAGGLDAVVQGTPWPDALVGGVVAAAVAVFSHDLFVEWLRDGRELLGKSAVPDLRAAVSKAIPDFDPDEAPTRKDTPTTPPSAPAGDE